MDIAINKKCTGTIMMLSGLKDDIRMTIRLGVEGYRFDFIYCFYGLCEQKQ